MEVKELQQLSDEKLNRMAAVQILWGGIVNVPSEDWKPCSNLSDVRKLVNNLNEIETLDYAANCADITGHHETSDYNLGLLVSLLKLSPRQHTIAAILAKVSNK